MISKKYQSLKLGYFLGPERLFFMAYQISLILISTNRALLISVGTRLHFFKYFYSFYFSKSFNYFRISP